MTLRYENVVKEDREELELEILREIIFILYEENKRLRWRIEHDKREIFKIHTGI